jgi:hypothetical protein
MLLEILVPGVYSHFDNTGHHLTVGAKKYEKGEVSGFPTWYGDFLIEQNYAKKTDGQKAVEIEEKEIEIKEAAIISITDGARKTLETLDIPIEELQGKVGTGKDGRIVSRDIIKWFQDN